MSDSVIIQKAKSFPCFVDLVNRVVAAQASQANIIRRSVEGMGDEDLAVVDGAARLIIDSLGSTLEHAISDYIWMCQQMFKAELQARRSRSARHANFQQVLESIYAHDAADMGRYMRGLMISQVVWRQHLGPYACFVREFLQRPKEGFSYLEVGPGHGLWLATAAATRPDAKIFGWDIHPESIRQTQEALVRMGAGNKVHLMLSDVCDPVTSPELYDAIVLSQVLEIVPSPELALANIVTYLSEAGIVFLNVPVRAAALDHVRRWNDAEEVVDLVEAADLEVFLARSYGARGSIAFGDEGYSLVLFARRRRGSK